MVPALLTQLPVVLERVIAPLVKEHFAVERVAVKPGVNVQLIVVMPSCVGCCGDIAATGTEQECDEQLPAVVPEHAISEAVQSQEV